VFFMALPFPNLPRLWLELFCFNAFSTADESTQSRKLDCYANRYPLRLKTL